MDTFQMFAGTATTPPPEMVVTLTVNDMQEKIRVLEERIKVLEMRDDDE